MNPQLSQLRDLLMSYQPWRLAASLILIMATMGSLCAQGQSKDGTLPAGVLRQLGDVRYTNIGHILGVTFSPNGRIVAGASWDETIRIWDVATGKELHQLTGHNRHVRSVAFSPDGKILLSNGGDQVLRLWDTATWKTIRTIEGTSDDRGSAIAPNNQWLVTRTKKNLILWELATGRELWRQPLTRPYEVIAGFGCGSREVVTLAYRNSSWAIVFRDTASGNELRQLETGLPSLASSTVSMNTRYLASNGWHALQLVNLSTGQRRQPKDSSAIGVECLVFSPNGKMLAFFGSDEIIHIWETATLLERCQFRGLERGRIPLAFAPDGLVLASGSTDSTVLLWDLTSARMGKPAADKLTQDELAALWSDLASSDAGKAYRAQCKIITRPDSALPFLKARIKANPMPAAAADVERLIDDLASAKFTVRDRATVELGKLGASTELLLRKALAKQPMLEVRRRLEKLLDAIEETRANPTPEGLLVMRAMEALESLGSPAAIEMLRTWAGGAPGMLETCEAEEALRNLALRRVP
jgi:hypothetical protein